MSRLLNSLAPLVFAVSLAAVGCHAQPPAGSRAGKDLSPELSRRVEVLLRQRASLPPGSTINVGKPAAGPIPGYDQISVSFTSLEGTTSHPIDFLLSHDGKTLAQFNKYDISGNPRELVSAEGRPYRGGAANAPVLVVVFDDLECPYCARMHATMFPAVNERYKDQVRVVYRDFPLEQHPWAMRAAVDTNCIAAQSNAGYWNVVDHIHAHAGEIGTPAAAKDGKAPAEKTLVIANEQLDKLTRDQGETQKVDMAKLHACIAKQDSSAIEESKKLAQSLHVEATPAIFINGDKVDGALPNEFIFKLIDQALVAEGKTPPPPFIAPKPAAPEPTAASAK